MLGVEALFNAAFHFGGIGKGGDIADVMPCVVSGLGGAQAEGVLCLQS